jgi:uncharacterized protein YbjT (DUF2867 family)
MGVRVLITGASGFVGSMLTSRLLGGEHQLVALARDPERVREALDAQLLRERRFEAMSGMSGAVELVAGDVLSGLGLAAALEGIDVAYYLIHSMESTAGGSFPERERLAAQNFATAAAEAGVGRIVYLGGLAGGTRPPSVHLASRLEVERILLDAVPGSVALGASIVIGAGSRSFRFLVRLIERMPVLALPAWRRFATQPIDARDVIEMLIAAASVQGLPAGRLEIGGPETLTYEQMIARIAAIMLVRRPALRLRVSLTPIAARVAAAIAAEDPELILALMEGLQGDLIPAGEDAAEMLGVELHSYDSAVEHALGEWEATERLAAR